MAGFYPLTECKNKGHKQHGASFHKGHRTIKDALLPTTHLFRHIHDRQYGPTHGPLADRLAGELASRQLPGLFRERDYKLGKINKIFASQWLSDKQVVFGTKCNKLIVLDLTTGDQHLIPSLKSSPESQAAECPCGIHSIAQNPSKTLLATGAQYTNDVAVYKLPNFDPVCVGEFGHTDWIFDMAWLDDQFLVTGSRDNTLALWNVEGSWDDDDESPSGSQHVGKPSYSHIRPSTVMICRKAEKVRAMAYNNNTQELVALSLNSHLHLWDANKFIQKFSHKLVHSRENVCLSVCETHNLYGVGSQSHISLIDPRSLQQINHIVSKQRGSGVRSLAFRDSLISMGLGNGMIMFYDLRAGRYMEYDCGHSLGLTMGKGWLLEDETYHEFFFNAEYPNAVYTHCMDDSGTKIFAAGGPLPAGLWGNYAGLWL